MTDNECMAYDQALRNAGRCFASEALQPVHTAATVWMEQTSSGTNAAWQSAWYYPDPEPAASVIKGRVAFWKGVRIEG